MIFSPNGAALVLALTRSNLFKDAPLGLLVLDLPNPRALPWADLWLARWAGAQAELHSNAARFAASNLSGHTLRLMQSRVLFIVRPLTNQFPNRAAIFGKNSDWPFRGVADVVPAVDAEIVIDGRQHVAIVDRPICGIRGRFVG